MLEKYENIKYPIFIQCCKYIDDKYWYSIFKQLSYGKPPFGCSIVNNALTYKRNSVSKDKFIYHFDNTNNPHTLFTDLKLLFKNKINLVSPSDREGIIHKVNNKMDDLQRTKWSDVKKKSDKELLIENFALHSMKTYKLTIHKTRKFMSFLNTSILFNCIKTTDIIIGCDGLIRNISGIQFKNNDIVISPVLYDIVIKDDNNTNTNKVSKKIVDLWEKYIISISSVNEPDVDTKMKKK